MDLIFIGLGLWFLYFFVRTVIWSAKGDFGPSKRMIARQEREKAVNAEIDERIRVYKEKLQRGENPDKL